MNSEWDMDFLKDELKSLDLLGFDLDLTGFGKDELNTILADPIPEGKTDPDAIPEQVETRCKPGDLWILGDHRLLCGDSTNLTDVEKLFCGEKAELCFTSPPYADQREYNGGKELSTEYIATFIRAAFGFCDYFAVNLGISRKNNEVNPYWDDYIKEAKNCGLKFLSWNVWDKGECGSIGNQTAMFGISHEWILFFGQDRKNLNLTVANKSAGERANHTGNRQSDGSIKQSKERIVAEFSQLKTIYSVTAQKARDDIDHPARFPVDFPLGYIEACTDPGQGVYEPFTGSGSTLIACEKTGRKCYGMEIDPHYCDIIIERWEKFTGKQAQLSNG
jgi:DNA modification methylase